MIAAFIAAGFQKIHLDTSMRRRGKDRLRRGGRNPERARPATGATMKACRSFTLPSRSITKTAKGKLLSGADMSITRRQLGLGSIAFGLAACSSTSPLGAGGPGAAGLAADLRPVPNAGYDAWVAAFRARAGGSGLSDATLASGFRGAGYLPGVVTRDRNQTEFKRSLEDYLSIAASEERVSKGRAALVRHGSTLGAIEGRFGVDAKIVAAIWGLESFYGERRGDVPVISATSTLAYDGRRGAFFEKQLVAALKILQNGDITASRMTGSWAGAMGHTQFIPTSYLAFAVDFTGDGRRDIWSDDPSDALASTAAYLQRNGWIRGVRWGGEVGRRRAFRQHYPASARWATLCGDGQFPCDQALQ